MIRLLSVVLVAVAATPILAQDPPPPQSEKFDGAPSADVDKAEVQELLEQVVEAYRSAPTLSDAIVMSAGDQKQTLELRFDRDNQRVEMMMPGIALTKIGDRLYFVDERTPEKYLDIEIEKDMIATVESLFGANAGLPFQVYARFGRGVDTMLGSLIAEPNVTGLKMMSDENGRDVHEILFSSPSGNASLKVDAETKFVTRVELELEPPAELGMAEPFQATMVTNPLVTESLPSPIVFEPGDRTAVTDLDEMMPEPPVAKKSGDQAPPFELSTLGGEIVRLADLEGSVVVLDFWATWCVPCIRAMPKMDEFAQWANESEHPIRVYAVNVWERARGDQRVEMVRTFWKDKGFKLPTLIDDGDALITAYGYQSIPTTVVIGPDGTIVKVHVGFSPQIDQELREDALKALGGQN